MTSFAKSCEKFVISFAICITLCDSLLSQTTSFSYTAIIYCSVCISIRKFLNFNLFQNLVNALVFVYDFGKNSLCSLYEGQIVMKDPLTEGNSLRSELVHNNRQGQYCIIDPSALLRPESKFSYKPVSEYRDYSIDENDPMKERVRKTYTYMHTYQNVGFVEQKMDEWCRFDKFEATIMDTLEKLNGLVDESDPDVDIPNIVHAFQTAEQIRKDYPDQKWFQLTGLIHDLGKVMALYGESQWAVVGDTFPVGCAWADSIVYRDSTFHENPDTYNPRYNTTHGIYGPNIGLENVLMSWGHDEYLYRVLKNHPSCSLPEEALYVIRFHSFYPWHTGEDYDYLCSPKDMEMKEWVKLFNKYDLYTKGSDLPKMEDLKQYYQSLIDEFIPGKLKW